MPGGLVWVVGTALCYGVASVLQSAAATDVEPAPRLDPRLLLTLARTWRYPAGLALDALGFILSLVALRSLPLYVVQAVVSCSLAVTAVVATVLLGLHLRRREIVALGAVVLGLTLVGLSAGTQPARPLGTATEWLVLASAVVVVLASIAVTRLGRRPGAWSLGAVSGVAFGIVAVGVRAASASVDGGRARGAGAVAGALASAPATYAVVLAAPVALLAYAAALQRGTVVEATAPLVVGETVLPAVAGLALLGDHPRAGWGLPALLGFTSAVGASVLLSRFGAVEGTGTRDAEDAPRPPSG